MLTKLKTLKIYASKAISKRFLSLIQLQDKPHFDQPASRKLLAATANLHQPITWVDKDTILRWTLLWTMDQSFQEAWSEHSYSSNDNKTYSLLDIPRDFYTMEITSSI
jgi:hypothetical protein